MQLSQHNYISTACQHGLCVQCRRVCKFCDTPCQCTCGHPENPLGPYEWIDESGQRWSSEAAVSWCAPSSAIYE